MSSITGVKACSLLTQPQEEKKKPLVAYAGIPSIGNLLNGSEKPPKSTEASAFTA